MIKDSNMILGDLITQIQDLNDPKQNDVEWDENEPWVDEPWDDDLEDLDENYDEELDSEVVAQLPKVPQGT